MLLMASQRRVGAALGYLNILAKNFVNLLYTPMLLSYVGQGDYGVYQTANSFVFTLTLLTFGFSEAYVRFYTQKKVQGSDEGIKQLNGLYLTLYLLVSLIALVIGLLVAGDSGQFFSASFTTSQVELASQLMTAMAFNVSLTLFSTVFDAFIIAHEQFKFQQSRQMFTTIATPVIALLLLKCGSGALGVAFAQLLITATLLCLNIHFAYFRLGMRFTFRHFDIGLFCSIAVFSGWIFINQLCDLINQSVPNMILGALTSAVTVSVFAVALQIRQVFYSLSTTLSSVFVPEINRIVAESNDNRVLTELMTRVGRYQMLLFCWVYCGFVLLGRFFIERWAGDSFVSSYYLICAMTLPVSVPLCQNTGIEIQRAKNKHRARSIVYLVMSLFNVLFTWIATPYLGYWAPAIAYIIGIAFGNGLFMNWYYHNRIGLDMGFFWKRNMPIPMASMLTLILCIGLKLLIPVSSWAHFILLGSLYTILFAIAMWMLVFDKNEKQAFKMGIFDVFRS